MEVCTLDSVLSDKHPTFIKMDIEGSELDALHGCKHIIQTDFPILAICIYHSLMDLYTIPLYIKELNPDYKLFTRKYGESEYDLVLFAVPPHRLPT